MKDKKVFLEKCLCNIKYGGIKKEEYLEISDEITEKNRGSLMTASMCLIAMFSVLFLGSLVSEMMKPNRTAYGVVGICFVGILIICWKVKGKGKKLVIPLWYFAMTLMCAYAIVLNTFIRKDISATTFCVIMIVAPLLFTDKPWRMFLYFIIVTAFFIALDFRQKAYYLAYTDTVNALCCVFIGTAVHFRIIRTKMREMMQRRHIEKERDTDKLTGCLTKAAFERKISEKLNTTQRHGVLLVMDLDHFKTNNDTYGHVYGDLVLRAMGECLKRSFPEDAMLGRFGGDEFQVWLPGEFERKRVTAYLDALLAGVSAIVTPDDRIKVGVSIGVAVCPANGTQFSTLFENADAALYSAKNLGRSRYVFCPDNRMRGTA